MNADLSNLDEVSANAPEPIRWNEGWNRNYPKNMHQLQTPSKGASPQDLSLKMRELIEEQAERSLKEQAERSLKATPNPHQYKMVIRHCRPDRTL